ncbi:oligoendopeptidase F [Caldibacillus lycopersici]|uniref:Oligopeptidase F n=1 Tax=Perspicuibacillus lycopersici TaxID=1325689 RepID=A0AAE3IS27_9BACI|nr:oligoendopeptidase F [Perspicuibacillus lycopersici]MCU9613580.1 oligoendopeptidase F [Perspicuibacillus lycopersici]
MTTNTASKRWARSEVPEHLTWDLTDLFPTREAWESELQAIIEALPSVTNYAGKLGESADTLLACLENYEALQRRVILVGTYASLRNSADGSDPVIQADAGKVASFYAQLNSELSFLKSEILQLEDGLVERCLSEQPKLADFRLLLDDILVTKPYTLSAETEKVLAALSEVHSAPYTIYNRSKLSDMEFASITAESGEQLPMSFALYEDKYEISSSTSIRRKAYESFVNTLKQYKNTFATAYATEVKKQVTLAKLRNYPSVTDMLLQPQKVTKVMYNNQLDIIKNELAPHMRKFARLKKEILGLDKLLFCDLKAPLDSEFNPSTTYEEASEILLDALSIMGEEYTEIIKKGLTERWVDLADNVGKSTGAFCSSPYGAHPYILITWTDSMRSAFVLAHELGHAGHFYLAGHNQRLVNTRPSMYFVEAPSTMNELLLAQHLLAKTDSNEMRRWVILQLLGTYYHNFVTHLLEGAYQREVYEWAEKGNPITATALTKIKGDILKVFWGEEVEIDEGAALTWMRQPHYYMGLYPYTYSAGLTISTAVAEKMKTEGQPVRNEWLEVLKSGGTLSPLDLAKKAGVDMSTPEPIRQAVAYVGTLVDELVKSYETE